LSSPRPQGLFGLFSLYLASARQQHELLDTAIDRLTEERIDGFERAGRCQIRLIGNVCSLHALERRPPGFAVLPVKARLGVTRTNSHPMVRLPEQIRQPAAGLASAAENQGQVAFQTSICHAHLLLIT
jgi:hypothetical protein